MASQMLAYLSSLPITVVYGSLSLFISILHNVFLLYYVDTFVSVYKIDKLSFWIGEVGFELRELMCLSELFSEMKSVAVNRLIASC